MSHERLPHRGIHRCDARKVAAEGSWLSLLDAVRVDATTAAVPEEAVDVDAAAARSRGRRAAAERR